MHGIGSHVFQFRGKGCKRHFRGINESGNAENKGIGPRLSNKRTK